jgi:hypothetical protein
LKWKVGTFKSIYTIFSKTLKGALDKAFKETGFQYGRIKSLL